MLYLLTNRTVIEMVTAARQGHFDGVLESACTLAKNCKGQPVLDLAVSLVALQEANEAQSDPDLCEWNAVETLQVELAQSAAERPKDTLRLCLDLVEQHGEWGKEVVTQTRRALLSESEDPHSLTERLEHLERHSEIRAEITEEAAVPAED